MIPVLAISLGGPMGLMFGVIVTAALGCAGGYVIGSALGRTSAGTPLSTTLRLSRERLASATAHLEKASTKLNVSRQADLAGSALVLRRRIADLSGQLGRIEHAAQKSKEGTG